LDQSRRSLVKEWSVCRPFAARGRSRGSIGSPICFAVDDDDSEDQLVVRKGPDDPVDAQRPKHVGSVQQRPKPKTARRTTNIAGAKSPTLQTQGKMHP
jgi:hypothetical protein